MEYYLEILCKYLIVNTVKSEGDDSEYIKIYLSTYIYNYVTFYKLLYNN